MAEQNGVRNAAEGGNDENGNHAGPFHYPSRVLRHHLDLERPLTPANGLNPEEAGRPRGFNNQDVRHAPPARSGYAFQARRRDVVNDNPPTLRLERPARAEEEEEFPILQENAQNTLPNPLRERLDAPHGDQEVPGNPEVFINQRAFEAAQEFRPRAANLPAQNEPLNFLPRENPLLRNNQGNPPLNMPPLNRAERVRGEEENNKQNVSRVSVQQRNRPVRVLPQVRPGEAYDADEKNDLPHSVAHPSLRHSRNCLCFLIVSLIFLPIWLLFLIHSLGGRARREEQPALRWIILARMLRKLLQWLPLQVVLT
jgi:hypothetical protein